MFYMHNILALVVRSIRCTLTRPFIIAALYLGVARIAADSPSRALGTYKISMIELSIGTISVPMLFLFAPQNDTLLP